MMATLPYATADVAAVHGAAKSDYTDFLVEELPLYEPSGVGDHTYFVLEKEGLTTGQAVREVARALGIPSRNVGVAGQKDARGITRQLMSIEHQDPDALAALSIPRLKICHITRHGNKLKTGHLRGNRFKIKMRDWDQSRLVDLERVLDRLIAQGVPNYFGPQRFGARGDTWEIGRALLSGDFEAACVLIAGAAGPLDEGRVFEARALFDRGDFGAAAAAWPRGFREGQVIAKGMQRFGGDCRRALFCLDKRMLGFYVSAFQSYLFNRVLAERIASFDKIAAGDVAWKHENGALFLVADAVAEQPRAADFEISPTGPLFGPKMKSPSGVTKEMEDTVLAQSGIEAERFPKSGPLQTRGGRRPLRVKLAEPAMAAGADHLGAYLSLSFSLPSGSYATSVLRELFKDGLVLSDGPRHIHG